MKALLADRRPLTVPAYRRWWAASLVTAVGGSFSVVAVPAQLYASTGSSAVVGGSAVVSFAGLITGALGFGSLADRHDRRRVLLAAQCGLAATYTGLWAQAVLGAPLPILLLLVACQGLSFGAIATISGAVLPRLVPPEMLAAANSLNSLVRYGGSILGPILAGLLLPLTSLSTLYICDALALLAIVWAVFHLPPMKPAVLMPTVRKPTVLKPGVLKPVVAKPGVANSARTVPAGLKPVPVVPVVLERVPVVPAESNPLPASPAPTELAGPKAGPAEHVPMDSGLLRAETSDPAGSSTGEPVRGGVGFGGFRYLRSNRLLMAVLVIDLAAMVFGMPVALFPELAHHTYGDTAGGGPMLGLLYAAYPAGVFLTGFFSGTFTRARHPGRMMAGAAIAWGGAVVLLGLAGDIRVAVTALVLGGAVNFVLSTYRNAITQAHTDDALRGRVQGILTVVLTGGPQLANLLHGTVGAFIGPRPAIIAGGLLTATTVATVIRATPGLRALQAAT